MRCITGKTFQGCVQSFRCKLYSS